MFQMTLDIGPATTFDENRCGQSPPGSFVGAFNVSPSDSHCHPLMLQFQLKLMVMLEVTPLLTQSPPYRP